MQPLRTVKQMDLAFYLLLGIAGLVIVVWFARYVFSVLKGNYKRDGDSLWFNF